MIPVQLYGMGKLEHTPKQRCCDGSVGKRSASQRAALSWNRYHDLGDTALYIHEGYYPLAAEKKIGRMVQLYYDRKALTAGTSS